MVISSLIANLLLAFHHWLVILHILSVLLLGSIGLMHHVILLVSGFLGMGLVFHSERELGTEMATKLGRDVVSCTTGTRSCCCHLLHQELLLIKLPLLMELGLCETIASRIEV